MSGTPQPLPFVRDQILGGKYRVTRVIGEGGMGVVVEAIHVELDERVAIKFMRPEMLGSPDVVARFDREARAAVRLKSEYVARVMDVGKTGAGVPYMVMEFLDGEDLGDTLSRGGPLPVTQAVEYIIQACEGIGEAHARGIVHRDVKPENLFLVKRDDGWRSIKVLDFGISKAAIVGASSVNVASSNTTNLMGSPHYMSPEQLRSTKTVDHRADVWSLGVVLFELLAGVMPFDETLEFTELLACILESPHRRIRAHRPDVSPALEAVIDRALEKDRTRRFQSTAELAVALLPFAPKRARAMAERLTSITRAAGLSDSALQVPPSDLPPRNDAALTLAPGAIGSPRVPEMTPVSAPLPPQSVPSITAAPEFPMHARPHRSMLVGGAIALLGLGALLAVGVRSLARGAAKQSTVATAPDPKPVVVQVPVSAAAPSARIVRRVLVVEPRDARVTIDGAPFSRATPWIEGKPGQSVLLHAEASGRKPSDATVTFDNDDPIVIALDPIGAESASHQHARVALAPPPAHASASVSAAPPPPPPGTTDTDVGY
ncbi:MAG TPA: serine/threonine-protein kinase [Polyangiaceae bacterium]|jgi:serine/threonine-protein kinase